MTVAEGKRLSRQCESFNESCFVLLTVETQCKGFLARLNNLMCSKDKDTGDELGWNSIFDKI